MDDLRIFHKNVSDWLKLGIQDVLKWECRDLVAEDWDNVPLVAAQVILYLHNHLRATVGYLKGLSEEETTRELRTCMERLMQVSNIIIIFRPLT